jgi:hypothetical protein
MTALGPRPGSWYCDSSEGESAVRANLGRFCTVNWICVAVLTGRAGRLTDQNVGCRPGQWADCQGCSSSAVVLGALEAKTNMSAGYPPPHTPPPPPKSGYYVPF